jgi:hypothetical protein
MNRRGFLGGLVATAAGLYLPAPKRIYSFPSSRYLRERKLLATLLDKRFLDGDADTMEQQFREMRSWTLPQLAAAEATIDEHIKVTDINFNFGSCRRFVTENNPAINEMDEQERFIKSSHLYRSQHSAPIVRGGIHINHPFELRGQVIGLVLSPRDFRPSFTRSDSPT